MNDPLEVTDGDEEVAVTAPGLFTLRAEYLAEGYYDEEADGNPPEQDLFRVQLTPHTGEAEAVSYPLLLPTVPLSETLDAMDAARRYLLALAEQLRHAPPVYWDRLCEASRAWPHTAA